MATSNIWTKTVSWLQCGSNLLVVDITELILQRFLYPIPHGTLTYISISTSLAALNFMKFWGYQKHDTDNLQVLRRPNHPLQGSKCFVHQKIWIHKSSRKEKKSLAHLIYKFNFSINIYTVIKGLKI
jgi:hypothetical protein